eukprot:9460100-Pyramimonas_sp.AAC.1
MISVGNVSRRSRELRRWWAQALHLAEEGRADEEASGPRRQQCPHEKGERLLAHPQGRGFAPVKGI